MEFTKRRLILWLCAAFIVGIWCGFGAFQFIIRDSAGIAIAVGDQRQLRHSVRVLKMLDENKLDLAVGFLESDIKIVLDHAPANLKLPMNEQIRVMFERELKFADAAMKDRSKTYLQLVEDAKK